LVFEVWARVEEVLRDEHGGGAAVGGRAALQLSERLVDHRGFHDLLERVDVLELRVGVALRVLVVDACDFGEVFGFGAEPVAAIVSEKWRGGEGEGRIYFSMYSRPALPNICAAPGAFVNPLVAAIISPLVPVGFALSFQKLCREPGFIFSNPTTRIQSAPPWLITFLAR
jgi:hypothetical protein